LQRLYCRVENLGFFDHFWIKAFLAMMTSLGISEGHTEESEELARLFIGNSSGNDDNIHAANFIDFIVFDFWED